MTRLLIAGPPCSGKTTLALELTEPGMLVLDRDLIAQRLGSPRTHHHEQRYTERAEQVMREGVEGLLRDPDRPAIVVRSLSRPARREAFAKRLGAEVRLLDPGMDECLRRAGLDRRPGPTFTAIRRWYAEAADTSPLAEPNECMDCGGPALSVRCERCCSRLRNGRPWRTLMARVFAEETHCWICGEWVDQDLPQTDPRSRTVDHVHQLRDGGPPLDRNGCRLAHRNCNTARTNQSRGRAGRQPLVVDLSSI